MKEEFKIHRWNVFRYDKKTKQSKLLGVVNALHQPDALGKGWKKFNVPRTTQELSKIYVRRKSK